MADDQNSVSDFTAQLQADGAADSVDGGSMGENPLTPGLGDPSPYSPGEQRPGGAASSPTPQAAAPGGRRKLSDIFKKRERAELPRQEAPPSREKRPKASGKAGRRVSAADTLGDVWSGVGALAIRTGHAPLGRCLQFQSQVSGEILDDALKGTVIDKVALQPIAKGRGRFDALGAVLGPPMIVFAIERNPAQIDVLMPMLKSSIRSSLPLMVPAIKRVQEKEAKAAEAAAELFPDLPPGADPVDAIIEMMFSDWLPPAPAPEPEENQPQPESVIV